jgi:hypothetical protein
MEKRVEALERSLARWRRTVGGIAVLAVLLPLAVAARRKPTENILRVRGIVIEDAQGRDRILIGAPVPGSPDRVRTDPEKAKAAWGSNFPTFDWYATLDHRTNGILILDERGHDRIALGDPTPDPNVGRRIAPGTGLQISDAEGYERTGYGLLTELDRVVLGLDSSDGTEGAMLVVFEDGTAGLIARREDRLALFGHLAAGSELSGLDEAFSGLLLRDGGGIRRRVDATTAP